MQRPGLLVSAICERFAPALLPYHCRELVEMLAELKCVELLKFPTNNCEERCGLFSKRNADYIDVCHDVTILDDNNIVIVEPKVNAITILGQFIGERRYDVADIYQCPCHPK